MAAASADALAQIEWTREWANPKEIKLPCRTPVRQIEDRQTRADIARNRGLTGNVEHIAKLMEGAGWQRRGSGKSEELSIVIKYRMVCTTGLRFWVQDVDEHRIVTGAQRFEGKCDLNMDKDDAAKYLSPDKRAELKKVSAEFFNARKQETEHVRTWNGKPHQWNGDELQKFRTRTDDVFSRTLHYKFCGNERQAAFHAAWRGPKGPLGAKKPKSKSK